MHTRIVILLACLAAAGGGGYSSNGGGTSLPARNAFTLTTTHVGRRHVTRTRVDCGTEPRLCRAVEVVLRAPARTLGICSCPAVTATVTAAGTLDGHPFPARRLTVCSGCGRSAAYRAALDRVLGAGGAMPITVG